MSLGMLLLFSFPFFCELVYKNFLRAHRGLAWLCIYATWRHLPSQTSFPQLYLYIGVGTFLLTFALLFVIFLYWNGAFTSPRFSRLLVT